MGAHGKSVAVYGQPRVAFDVASGARRFAAGAAEEDLRDHTEIRVPELPWTLRFYWARWEEDGVAGVSCVGFQIGDPIAVDSPESLDLDAVTVTAERLTTLWSNFNRYRSIAQDIRYPTATNVQAAAVKRTTMRKRTDRALTDDFLAGVVADWRAFGEQPGAMNEFAASRNRTRFTVRRWLIEAEARGLCPPELRRRRPS